MKVLSADAPLTGFTDTISIVTDTAYALRQNGKKNT